ncbi:MAG TPA: M20/M25/M40 family metallo-hydrolase, partial [Polyangiaceae bacterium]|nr:M20/M25/M40 family metallo-hydrolase [Polyangiaceae bacterium]
QVYEIGADRPAAQPRLLSSGKGASRDAAFLSGDREIIYASSGSAADACAPRSGGSEQEVWPLPSSMEIFRASADGSNPRALTSNAVYDAEPSVCAKDGSILFTSLRDGDVDLYRMDANGQNVERITHAAGYDGRAAFSPDCERIVWEASRPAGAALEEYQRRLAQKQFRPSNLEIHIAKADGTDERQLTYFHAQSFTPTFAPNGQRILFSSNTADPDRREFALWGLDADGARLEQLTFAPGFNGFPAFSPDGHELAFSSSRAARPGNADTNVFVAGWVEAGAAAPPERAADRVMRDIRWLADPARDGRGVGTPGLKAAGEYIEAQFRALGLEPAAGGGSYRQALDVVTQIQSGPGTRLSLNGKAPLPADQFQALGFSASGAANGKLVLAGYGIQLPELGRHDYDGVQVKGNIVVVRRFVPDTEQFQDTKLKRMHGDLREKAWTARERGAKAMIVVDAPERPAGAAADWKPAEEAAFPALERETYGDAGIPVLIVKREAFAPSLAELEQGHAINARLAVELSLSRQSVFNVIAKLPARAPAAERLPGAFVVGAHYDHLGYGGSFSLAPDDHSVHGGADDNASGVSLVLEVARRLSKSDKTRRDIFFVTFTGEEMGVLGSSYLVKNPPPGLEPQNIHAMLNYDMVGRLTQNTLSVLGAESAAEWKDLVPKACDEAGIDCKLSGSGYGPSDHSSFYAAGVPVLHFFTGAHSDYHKPSDRADRINAAGVAQIAELTSYFLETEAQPGALAYRRLPPEEPRGDLRTFNASLGTIPDYAGPPDQKGVLLSGVRPGSGAALGGMQRGDVLVQLGTRSIEDVHDLMYALNSAKPHQTVTAVVLRDGKRVELKVTYQEKGGGAANPRVEAGKSGEHGAPATPQKSGEPATQPTSSVQAR